MRALFNLGPKIEKLLNQTWQSSWQLKNLRFVLNHTFHLQVRSFSFELFEVKRLMNWEENMSRPLVNQRRGLSLSKHEH